MGNCCKDKARKGGAVLAAKKGKENIAKQERYIKTYKPFLRQFVKNTKTANFFQEKKLVFCSGFCRATF